RTPRRFADGFGVVTVVLAAFDIGFDVMGRDETRLVAERVEFTSPVVGTATGFQSDLGGREFFEERTHLPPAQIGPDHRLILCVYAMDGEDGLGRVDRDAFILGHGRLRFWLPTAPILARDAVGPSTPTIDVLAELLAARRGLVKDRTAASNRGQSLTLPMLKRQCQRHREQIDSQIKAIDREWISVLAANPAL